MTSAPMSLSIIPAMEGGVTAANSRILRPASGPAAVRPSAVEEVTCVISSNPFIALPVGQHPGEGRCDGSRRAGRLPAVSEARSRSRNDSARASERAPALGDMRMPGRFAEAENRANAGIDVLEYPSPVLTRMALEGLGYRRGQDVPFLLLVLPGKDHLVQAQAGEQGRKELRLDRADGHVLAVAAFVSPVERRTTVEQV